MKYLGEAGLEHIRERTRDAYSGKPRPWRRFGGKRQKWVKVHTLTLLAMIVELEETIVQRDNLLVAAEEALAVLAHHQADIWPGQGDILAVKELRAAIAGARGGG